MLILIETTGALDGGSPMSQWQCNMSLLLIFPQCHMLNLRNKYVPCHYSFSPHVACDKALCYMSILRNAHVTLSILGVNGHNLLHNNMGQKISK